MLLLLLLVIKVEKVHKLASAFVRKSAYYFYWNANAQCLKNEQKGLSCDAK